jgi:nucleotide-binding universal stress UspA family protein
MIEIRRILCPIDFSDFSRRALDHAAAIAKWYGSTLTLLHVSSFVPVASYAPASGMLPHVLLTPQERDAVLDLMKQFAESETGRSVPTEFEVAQGHAVSEILARASAMPADLLVLGTHGRSGFERLALGSVTEKVLRKATGPVLTVPRGLGDVVPAPPILFEHIVCAVDFSECSMHALNYAISLAQQADAHLTVLHVIELPFDVPHEVHETIAAGPRDLREYIALAEEDSRARLKDAIPDAVRAYCVVDTVLRTGKPYREILRVASETESDLIVIGIHGRGVADLLFFGSTTQHVVRQASCPVLTLRRQ